MFLIYNPSPRRDKVSDIKILGLKIQDLPTEIILDLASPGGRKVLERAIESLQSEVLYNSSFDEAALNGRVDARVVAHFRTKLGWCNCKI